MFHIRTVDPDALKAIGVDINKAVIGPEWPEKVNNDVEFWSVIIYVFKKSF